MVRAMLGVAMGIPTDLDWAGVLSSIGDLLSTPIVLTGVTVSIALRFGPRILRAVRRAMSSG